MTFVLCTKSASQDLDTSNGVWINICEKESFNS